MFIKRIVLNSTSSFIFLWLAFALIGGVVLTYGLHDTITCPKCDGKGELYGKWFDFDTKTWWIGYKTCNVCNGTGIT